jgi:hypothetical protein
MFAVRKRNFVIRNVEQTAGSVGYRSRPARARLAPGKKNVAGKARQSARSDVSANPKYENGTNRIGAAKLQRIAQILGVSVSALYPDPVPAGQNSQEVAELIDTGSTLRLLRAYSRMRSPSLQRALTTLVEEIAEKS